LRGQLVIEFAVSHVNLCDPLDQLLFREPVLLLQKFPECLGAEHEAIDVHLHLINLSSRLFGDPDSALPG